MALETVPTDVIADDLIRTYHRGIRRLEAAVRLGLERGLDLERLGTPDQRVGDATQAYRARQLAAARAIVGELERAGARAAPVIARRAYESAIFAVDRHAYGRGSAALATRFGGVHQRAVAALAANMSSSLEAAAGRTGANVAAIFARADALERGVPPRAFPFVGRRVDDPWRRVALDTVAQGLVTLDTRRQVTAQLARRLVTEGITDALTGYVDARGARWSLDRYATMVARTTTREATSRATVNRLDEHGLNLVTVSSHPHAADECTPYDGETFSLDGGDEEYEELDELPPFHPNCRHVIMPAGANLDRFERDLATAAENGLGPEDVAPPATPGVPAPPPAGVDADPPPFGASSPSSDSSTPARLQAQDAAYALERRGELDVEDLIAADPGPDADAERARDRAHNRQAREDLAAMNTALGPDVVQVLDDIAAGGRGYGWARRAQVREDLLAGRTTLEEVEERALELIRAQEARALERELVERESGLRRGSIPCFVCGRRKRRPSDVCDHCGDDPVTYGGSAAEFDEAYGYGREGGRTAGFD